MVFPLTQSEFPHPARQDDSQRVFQPEIDAPRTERLAWLALRVLAHRFTGFSVRVPCVCRGREHWHWFDVQHDSSLEAETDFKSVYWIWATFSIQYAIQLTRRIVRHL